ncbi:MAG: hypothetical protein COA79_13385 [Planctomycetota bacterium]|nr:MAG: hypothetical protein COA79_13385 [Planctomycetota bacterium]
METKINSDESEGAFNEFIEEQLEDLVDQIINDGNLNNIGDQGSDIIVEIDGITPPQFVYDNEGQGGSGGAGAGPGGNGGKMKFNLPFKKLMELISSRLRLPNLTKEGQGAIKELSYEFRTYAPVGVLLDKRRTFKRALRTSVATKVYDPANGKFEFAISRKDKRYKQPEIVEKPKYKAVVFYMGDISYSTYGERLELEKNLVNFIQNWLDFNYGPKNVEHRFFVHDSSAYEVTKDDFYNINNAGGTKASIVFELVSQIATSEYDANSTNFYGFYFGDGELFDKDPKDIMEILENDMRPWFNRIGIVEVIPSNISNLIKNARSKYPNDSIVRLAEIKNKNQTVEVIKKLFGGVYAKH